LPLNKSSLAGVWEAILPYGDVLIHIELGTDQESFLARVSYATGMNRTSIYSLHSYSIKENDIVLRFLQGHANGGSVMITGKVSFGETASSGVITGVIETGNAFPLNGPVCPISIVLKKGTWTREFDQLSKIAEDAVERAKAQTALETGSIYNIPIYHQVILAADWADRQPSPEETRSGLRCIQLFLEYPKNVNNSQKDIIGKILTNQAPYRVQFIGITRENRQIILCNFFTDRSRPNGQDAFPLWKKERVHGINHGGADFWQIEYDPQRHECLNFSSN